jgi:hypothetical protein
MNLEEVYVRPILESETSRFNQLLQAHHYLGSLRPIGETLRYVATYQTHWVALLSFSSAALKCAARDQWIGWSYRHQFDRLNLITNNSRFLILPDWHVSNLASRLLSVCQKRLPDDWIKHFGHPLLLLETFVDPKQFQGTIYKASNWQCLGKTAGYRRYAKAYDQHHNEKLIFVYPLQRNTRRLLSLNFLPKRYQCGAPNLMLTAEQMKSLPEVFKTLPDPRRAQGRRHRLSSILAICAGAVLCGRVGYKGIWQWANSLSQDARRRFICYYKLGVFYVPSESIIRDTLIRVDPDALDRALSLWSERYAIEDESLAIDGKTMRAAVDSEGKQVHIMSAVGHESLLCYSQKKSVSYA